MIASPPELLRRYGLAARHSWGQNFLHEPAIHRAIVAAADARPGARIVEIGAGLGTLTAPMLAAGAEVWAIERDRDLCAVLRAELGAHPNFRLFEADAVRFDYGSAREGLADGALPTIVGNLPYQITGPLLFAFLAQHAVTGPWVVMIQREVADRLCADPGSRTYGGPTVMLSRSRRISTVIQAGRACFVPRPRVDSTVIRLDPRATPRGGPVGDEEGLRRLVQAAFQQRRKQLLNALAGLGGREAALRWCEAAGVDPQVRPERLGPEEFAALQRAREADPAVGRRGEGSGGADEDAKRRGEDDGGDPDEDAAMSRRGEGIGGADEDAAMSRRGEGSSGADEGAREADEESA